MIQSCVRDNIAAIEQGLELLAGIGETRYTERLAVCYNGAPGGHMRHIIEHYLSFLQGLGAGAIDYEARARDPRIESEPGYAAAQLRGIVEGLAAFSAEDRDRPLRVRAETAPEGEAEPWGESSALRELEFLLSHTVHHYALVAVMCRLLGYTPAEDFGMAPSTLRYLKTRATACAH